MERILAVYARPYNCKNPVICYDERPCFLIGEIVKGLAMKAEQVSKEHYAYEKLGSCNLLATIEPLTGVRMVDVFDQRRKIEFALHFQRVAAAFPEAEKITVILDNLNTHNESSFYEAFSAEEAKRLSDKARVYLYAAQGKLAEYHRDRVFGNFQTLFRQTDSQQGRIRKGSAGNR